MRSNPPPFCYGIETATECSLSRCATHSLRSLHVQYASSIASPTQHQKTQLIKMLNRHTLTTILACAMLLECRRPRSTRSETNTQNAPQGPCSVPWQEAQNIIILACAMLLEYSIAHVALEVRRTRRTQRKDHILSLGKRHKTS